MTRLASNKQLARVKAGTKETVIGLYPRRGEYTSGAPVEVKAPKK
jgi:hypothetical protein